MNKPENKLNLTPGKTEDKDIFGLSNKQREELITFLDSVPDDSITFNDKLSCEIRMLNGG